MPESKTEVLKLTSVTLTREKQDKVDIEFDRYLDAVNYAIRAIMKNHIASGLKAFEFLNEDLLNRFDKRPQYVRDVVKTAWGEVREHRRLSQTIRSMRDKTPVFKWGRIIFSPPIVSVDERSVQLQTGGSEIIPIPFDKRSRNRILDDLKALVHGPRKLGRVRMTLNREGYMDIDIRVEE